MLLEALGPPPALVVMEATGHYWKNLFASLVAAGHDVVLLNPIVARRFQQARLERTKTDAIDAAALAHFAFEKRPTPSCIHDAAAEALRELVRHRDRLQQDFDLSRRRLKDLESDIGGLLVVHGVGRLLTSIDGIGPNSAARIIALVGDPARFRSAGAFAAYVGVVPSLRQSGKRTGTRAATGFGNARLRSALWMTTLAAVRLNDWLRSIYERPRAAGKPPKPALIAAM